MGVAAADYDNDGRHDLYLTALGGNRLFRNDGGGRFADVTAKAGRGQRRLLRPAPPSSTTTRTAGSTCSWPTTCEWSPEKDLFCTLDGKTKSYCTPESYQGQSPTLYRNRGDGTFEDVTTKAGLRRPRVARRWASALLDYDGDGWPDLFVANDTQPNKLYRNNGNGTFKDVGMAAGIAFGESGRGARRHGRRRRRLRRHRAGPAWSSATSRTR